METREPGHDDELDLEVELQELQRRERAQAKVQALMRARATLQRQGRSRLLRSASIVGATAGVLVVAWVSWWPHRDVSVPSSFGGESSSNVASHDVAPSQRATSVDVADPEDLVDRAAQVMLTRPASLAEDFGTFLEVGYTHFGDPNPTSKDILWRVVHGPSKLREALVGLFVLGLNDPDPNTRVAAVNGILEVIPNDPGIDIALRRLAESGGGGFPEVRSVAMNILRRRPTPDNLAFMARVISEPDRRSDDELNWSLIALDEHQYRVPLEDVLSLFRHRNPYVDARAAMLAQSMGDQRGRPRMIEILQGDVAQQPHKTKGARVVAMRRLVELRDPDVARIAKEWLYDPGSSEIELSTAARARVELGAGLTRDDVSLLLKASDYPIDHTLAIGCLAASGDVFAPVQLLGLFEHAIYIGEWDQLIIELHRSTAGEFREQIAQEIVDHDWKDLRALAAVKRTFAEKFGEYIWPTQRFR